ncbi:general stress protein 26 [Microbacterium endophyticum]|uniref:General stress protein 26 n=1 Tax=Microbacterium endophyticum TaxID=1526412 RepID=A0A7W4YNA8_9MICO|nr:pyridoxamine 5'-phosphate oxidase family protein [Microbacterium endophyticum]MBB2975491.1 general stress protein 26 [Microbacterium endophyticum]NIK35490.1 general stress protein 26 [Microbacterium endophyticum]
MSDDQKTLAKLIDGFRFAMLTSIQADGALVAHPLTVQESEFDGDLWFIVAKDSPVASHLHINSHVGVSMSSKDTWVSLTGSATLVDDETKLKELWSSSTEAWFPEGPEDPNITLLKFDAEGAEYWTSDGSSIVRAAKLLSGNRPAGTNEKVDL